MLPHPCLEGRMEKLATVQVAQHAATVIKCFLILIANVRRSAVRKLSSSEWLKFQVCVRAKICPKSLQTSHIWPSKTIHLVSDRARLWSAKRRHKEISTLKAIKPKSLSLLRGLLRIENVRINSLKLKREDKIRHSRHHLAYNMTKSNL